MVSCAFLPEASLRCQAFFCRTGIFCRFKTPISICQTVSANSFTAAVRSGYAPFATPCQQLFYFFLPFLHTLFLTHFFPLLFFYTALYSRPLPPGTDRRRERVPPCCCVADAYCMPVRLCFLLPGSKVHIKTSGRDPCQGRKGLLFPHKSSLACRQLLARSAARTGPASCHGSCRLFPGPEQTR